MGVYRNWRLRRFVYGARWWERTKTARKRAMEDLARADLPKIRRLADAGWEAVNPDGSTCKLPCMCSRHGGRP